MSAAPLSTGTDAYAPPVVLTLSEFLALNIPPRQLLLSPWLLTQGLAMLYSWRGVGKTHMALNIAYAVSSGGAFLNWNAPVPRKVLYLDGEMPAHAMQERFARIVKANGQREPEGYFRLLTPDMQPNGLTPNLATLEGQDQINSVIEADTALVVVDNLSCLARSQERENDAESWQAIAEWALPLRARGIAVLFVHHAGKNGTQRGTSKREDQLDAVLMLKRPEEYESKQGACFEIHFEKARGLFGDDVTPIEAQLTLDQGGAEAWAWRYVEDATLKRVAALADEGAKQKDVADEMGLSRFQVNRLLGKAREKGLTTVHFSRGGNRGVPANHRADIDN